MLLDQSEKYQECPRCGSKPFESFMRGLVQRNNWFGFRKQYCAVICSDCKQIVGYEGFTKEEILWRALG